MCMPCNYTCTYIDRACILGRVWLQFAKTALNLGIYYENII